MTHHFGCRVVVAIRSLSFTARLLIVVVIAHSLGAQTPPAQPWLEVVAGLGANTIASRVPPDLRGTPQALAKVGAVVPRGRWGIAVDVGFSRYIEAMTGQCAGHANDDPCHAPGFALASASVGVLRSRGAPQPRTASIGVGAGVYHMLRTHWPDGGLAARTTVGTHAELQAPIAHLGPVHPMVIARTAWLPRLYGRSTWSLHVGVGVRAGL
jgi:hypothetical protein